MSREGSTTTGAGAARSSQVPVKATPTPGGSPGIPAGWAFAPGEGHRLPFLLFLPLFGDFDFGDFLRGEGAAPLS